MEKCICEEIQNDKYSIIYYPINKFGDVHLYLCKRDNYMFLKVSPSEDGETEDIVINYCPFCGRKLMEGSNGTPNN